MQTVTDYWIIPCSPQIYDAEGAFNEYGEVVWHQDCNIKPGDIVYIYVTAPIKEIRCKCTVSDTDIPVDIGTDEGYTLDDAFCSRSHRRYMCLQLVKTYNNPFLGFQFLLYHGLNGTVRGQRRIPSNLQKYIAEITEDKTNADD